MIAKFAKILRVTGVKTGIGVLIFDVNRSRIGVGFCNFGAGLESESQKSDSGHLWIVVCSKSIYKYSCVKTKSRDRFGQL